MAFYCPWWEVGCLVSQLILAHHLPAKLFLRLVLQDFTEYQNLINAFGCTKSLVRHEMDPTAYWIFLREMPLAKLGLIYAGLPTSTGSIERVWSACGSLQDGRHIGCVGMHGLFACFTERHAKILSKNEITRTVAMSMIAQSASMDIVMHTTLERTTT